MPWRLLGPILAILLAACSAPGGPVAPGSASSASLGGSPYGVVLIGTGLEAAAERIEADRMTALVSEATTVSAVRAAIAQLHDEAGLERVAVVAASHGAETAIAVGSESPELIDQLIAIDAAEAPEPLGPFPKLFIAFETDLSAAERLAEDAPGDWNEAARAVDEEALIRLILGRLDERR